MNITLRRNQKIDIEIPIQRFPSFQSGITLLGVNIPTGVFLSFNMPVSSPRGGESIRMTIQTNSLFTGGNFSLTGTPTPTSPIAFNLTVNNELEQYEVKYSTKTKAGTIVPNALIQVYDLITGVLINSTLSTTNETTSLNVPLTYRRVKTVVTPNSELGLVTKTQLLDLPEPHIQKTVTVPIILEDDTVSVTLKMDITSSVRLPDSVDTVKVTYEGVVLHELVEPSGSLNPKLVSVTFPLKKPFPKELNVTVERSGHITYSTVVRYNTIPDHRTIYITLTKIPSQEDNLLMTVNYVYSRYTDEAPQKVDLRLRSGYVEVWLSPSNFKYFLATNIVPLAERSVSSSATGVIPRTDTLELMLAEETSALPYETLSTPTPPSSKALAIWNQVSARTSNGATVLHTRNVVGKRIVSVEVESPHAGLDMSVFEVYSDEAMTRSLTLLAEPPATRGVLTPRAVFSTSLDYIYVFFRSKARLYHHFQRVPISHFPEGSIIQLLVTGVPYFSLLTNLGVFTDFGRVAIKTNLAYDFNAAPSLSRFFGEIK